MFLGAVSQKTEMTDAHEAIRQDMEQKPADKLLGIQSHRFQPIFVFAVPVGEPPLALGKSHDLERCTFLGPDRDSILFLLIDKLHKHRTFHFSTRVFLYHKYAGDSCTY